MISRARTWGDLLRTHHKTCAALAADCMRETVGAELSSYCKGLARAVLLRTSEIKAQPPRAPAPNRTAEIGCAGTGCSGSITAGAREVWDRAAAGRPETEVWCTDCQSELDIPTARREHVEPWTDAEREKCAARNLAAIVELDHEVFSLDTSPVALAAFSSGEWDRYRRCWEAAAWWLALAVGEDEAKSRLRAARARAGTAGLVAHWRCWEPPSDEDAQHDDAFDVHDPKDRAGPRAKPVEPEQSTPEPEPGPGRTTWTF